MSVQRFHVRLASLVVVLGLAAVPALAQEHHTVIPADKVQWQAAPPMLPAGAQISVLDGNPMEKGPVTLRLKFPANYKVPPHWHSMAEGVTVVSGVFYIGAGETIDRAGSQGLRPGGFVSLPAKMHHYAWVSGETVVQINLQGPFDIYYVNPADDPQKTPAPNNSTRR